jgi:hypothetical protein
MYKITWNNMVAPDKATEDSTSQERRDWDAE